MQQKAKQHIYVKTKESSRCRSFTWMDTTALVTKSSKINNKIVYFNLLNMRSFISYL